MGRHSLWRKEAKKARRKRIRQSAAIKRCKLLEEEQRLLEQSPSYQRQCEEQEAADRWQEEEERRQAQDELEQWEKREAEAQQQWRESQERLKRVRSEKARQDQIIRDEWEREQKLLVEKQKLKQELLESAQKKEAEFRQQIEDFISNGGALPPELNVVKESNPDKATCPFFQKTGVCRFSDSCSRNHLKPGVSRTLLIPGFYSHFGMEQSNQNEYDADISLEYDDDDTYAHFTEFYTDVYPEFQQCGEVEVFKVCCNFEQHLRGNVYVEYQSVQEATKAYQIFQGRWYGGKQLAVEFTNIPSWKSAICGLFSTKRCPKGRSCNFLHVFLNPGERFSRFDRHRNNRIHTNRLSQCRWSESPEVELNGDKHQRKRSRCHESGSKNRSSREFSSRDRNRNEKKYSNRDRSESSTRNGRRRQCHRKEHKRRRSRDKS